MAVFGRVGNWRVRTRSPSQRREHPSFFLSLCIFVRRAHTDHSHPLPFLTCFVARRTCHTPLLQSRCTYSKTLFPFHSTARRLSWPHRTFETANVCPVTYYSWILQRKRSASRGNRGPFVWIATRFVLRRRGSWKRSLSFHERADISFSCYCTGRLYSIVFLNIFHCNIFLYNI